MAVRDLLSNLNPPQRAAVATKSGPMLVLAGAGTGKTRVVTFRIAKLIQSGIKADRILAVTFTNKAAAEMRGRAMKLLGRNRKAMPEVSTFHSLCVRILRRHIEQLGYPQKFTICDRSDQENFARDALRQIRVPNSVMRPSDLLFQVSTWKSHAINPTEAAAQAYSDKEHLAAAGFRKYQKALKAAGAVDFDDLLLCTEELFRKHTDVRRSEAARFDHVMIDEYQDTNQSQYRIVKALAIGHRNLCVVGDDDQSIYGWRGAEVKHILSFQKDWPEAKIVRLEDNYRCTEEILSLANELIACNKQRHGKVLRADRKGGERPAIKQFETETLEAEEVVAEIRRRIETKQNEPGDFAILFRTNEQPRVFETELRRWRLPYVLIGGMSFYDRKEVRDVLAYLKILDSTNDDAALLRIINTPPRGISQTTAKKAIELAGQRGIPIWDVLKDSSSLPNVRPNTKAAIDSFVNLIEKTTQQMQPGQMGIAAEQLIREIDYESELDRLIDDPQDRMARWQIVEEIINGLARYERDRKKPTLRGFLDASILEDRDMGNEKENKLKQNAIVLMTLHSAKGLEFPDVYLVGMEEGILPHKRSVAEMDGPAVEEERRLCYVGITRAQERLTLTMAKTRMKWGQPNETYPSRFLYEMTGQMKRALDVAKAYRESNKKGSRRRGKKTPHGKSNASAKK